MVKSDFKLLVKEVVLECMDEIRPKKKKNTVKMKKSELKETIKNMVIDQLLESKDVDENLKSRVKDLKSKKLKRK